MMMFNVRNVNDALVHGLNALVKQGETAASRAGEVLVTPGPVLFSTSSPRERVVFSPVRDANPFFHLVESMWMLNGMSSVSMLNVYVKDFGERFAENGDHVHGAYGQRWRSTFGFDQLEHAVQLLARNPESRQVVIQMWDARNQSVMAAGDSDFNVERKIGENDLLGEWKDRPCNTHVYLRIRPHERTWDSQNSSEVVSGPFLDMTVCCRSNDAVWGAHGANAVHFSFLQEFLASRLGIEVGTLYQFANNYHAYRHVLETMARRTNGTPLIEALADNRYEDGTIEPGEIFDTPEHANEDINNFCLWHEAGRDDNVPQYRNDWFPATLEPAVLAFKAYRANEKKQALRMARTINCDDWRVACVEWLERRAK